MMKILITGANGQVGQVLWQRLQGKAEILATDREILDITDRAAVLHTVSAFLPDVIINAAAYTAVDKAEIDEEVAFAVNCDGARYLAEAAQNCGAWLLHLSTDYVFDGQGGWPYRENDAVAPQSVYGKSKLAGEAAVAATCERHIILRTAWVFGEHGRNFVKTMLKLAQQRDVLGIVADQYGAPTYADDIAATLICMVEQLADGRGEAGIYHYSGSPYVSWYEFATEIFRQAVAQGILPVAPVLNPIATADYPTPAKRPANSCLDLSKIQTAFGIVPSDWKAALNDLQGYTEAV